MLASSMSTLPTSVSAELQSRISTHVMYAPCNVACDIYLILYSELESIQATTAKWTKQERKMWRRLLDARRVAEKLEDVMNGIHKANERFMVRSLRERYDIAPLILRLDGDHCEDGGESGADPRGRRSHHAEYGGCQRDCYKNGDKHGEPSRRCRSHQAKHDKREGACSSMARTSSITHDDGRIEVRTIDL
jgi:hypothetical protein